jgi:hypothetical protein
MQFDNSPRAWASLIPIASMPLTDTVTINKDERGKALAILAKSVSRELFAVGYTDKDIVTLATSLLTLVKKRTR